MVVLIKVKENSAITYQQLKQRVDTSIRSIPSSSYSNYMKYAYKDQSIRKYTEKIYRENIIKKNENEEL